MGRVRIQFVAWFLGAAACTTEPAPRPAIWSEYLSPEQVLPALPRLAAQRIDVNLAVAKGRWSDADVVRVVRAAEGAGVGVRLWPLVTFDEGYWATESNADVFAAHVRHVMELAAREGLATRIVEIDVEMHWNRVLALRELQAEGRGAGELLAFFGEGLHPEAFEEARGKYAALVEEMHRRGFEAHLSTIPMVLDDFEDGDDTIQDVLDVPVTGIAWDRLSFQLYRTSFQHDYGALVPADQPITAHVVHDYARTAVARFGAKAAVDLGLIQSAGSGFEGYDAPTALREDVAAALHAGVRADAIQLFALDGLLEQADWGAWLSVETVAAAAPASAESTRSLRATFRLLDEID